jgi:hypothetical protein
MKTVSTWRVILGSLILTGGLVAACSNHQKAEDTAQPPLGHSTAPGPANPSVPLADSAGVPSPDQPARENQPITTLPPARDIRTAQVQTMGMDAGVGTGPRMDGGMGALRSDGGIPGLRRDGGMGVGSGATGGTGIGSGIGSGVGSGMPGTGVPPSGTGVPPSGTGVPPGGSGMPVVR